MGMDITLSDLFERIIPISCYIDLYEVDGIVSSTSSKKAKRKWTKGKITHVEATEMYPCAVIVEVGDTRYSVCALRLMGTSPEEMPRTAGAFNGYTPQTNKARSDLYGKIKIKAAEGAERKKQKWKR